ncbi:alpha/beta hydrolase [Jiangella rhizosphaerae]|uniref:alpha/beta hydrolase n=1 Tax=Jiangella rhizosphaerae TaxID=2293569 RepID=UPI0018F6C00C|nr:alpha/beta fold hydrolase [Jiangella rhizosphaerae]
MPDLHISGAVTAPRPDARPQRSGHSRRLQAADGTLLHARYFPRRDGRTGDLAVVVAHGFTQSSRSPQMKRIASWLSEHASVVLLDLRGHGRSRGHSTLGWREVLDMDAAVNWAHALGYRRVATLGFSLGSAVAIRHGALHRGVGAVAAVSVPGEWFYRGTAAMRTLLRLILTKPGRMLLRLLRRTRVSPAGWSTPDPIDARAAAAELDVPLLVVHGDKDDYFPVHHAWQVHAAAPVATLWLERGFGHAEAGATESLVTRIGAWLDEHTVAAEPVRGMMS